MTEDKGQLGASRASSLPPPSQPIPPYPTATPVYLPARSAHLVRRWAIPMHEARDAALPLHLRSHSRRAMAPAVCAVGLRCFYLRRLRKSAEGAGAGACNGLAGIFSNR